MQNKNPQGNITPSIPSDDDLDRYGVWVKVVPQDTGDDKTSLGKASEIKTDFLADIGDLEDIDSLDLPELPLSIDIDINNAQDKTFNGISLESNNSSSNTILGFKPQINHDMKETNIKTSDTNIDDNDIIDISLDELDYAEVQKAPELTIQVDAQNNTKKTAPKTAPTLELTEISLDDFGIDTADSDTPVFESNTETSIQTDDFENVDMGLEPIEDITLDDGFESIDIDLDFDDTIPEPATDMSGFDSENNDFEPVDLDSFDTIEPKQATQEPQTISKIDKSFDDVQAVTDDLGSENNNLSADLLQKIALDLSSIKEELVSLRSQLSTLKQQADTANDTPTQKEPDDTEDETIGGFFDDEEDDTIALTGDELDNILNTADFTEEQADLAGIESTDSFESIDKELNLVEDIQLLPEDGVYDLPKEDIDISIKADTAHGDTQTEIEQKYDVVEPLADIPEDTSFLDSSADIDSMFDTIPDDEQISELSIIEEHGDNDIPFAENIEEPLELDNELVLDIEASDYTNLDIGANTDFIEEIDDIPTLNIGQSTKQEPSTEPSTEPIKVETQKKAEQTKQIAGDIKSVLLYLDKLLASLPEDKIEEFASSEHYDTYRKLFEELGLL